MEPLPVNAKDIIAELQMRSWVPQRRLAKEAGIAQQTLSNYARGYRVPTLDVLGRIAAAAGYQLRISLEPAASDVMRDLKAVSEQSLEAWLAELGLVWRGARMLVRDVPHRYEGLVGARLHGIPVTMCSVVEVAVPDDDATLTALVANAARCLATLSMPENTWASAPYALETLRAGVTDGFLTWHPYRVPEVRMRLADDLGCTSTVALGAEDSDTVPVAPIGELVVADARVARMLRVVRGGD
jgi:transcriptional regulator with XRE-family HTH domain